MSIHPPRLAPPADPAVVRAHAAVVPPREPRRFPPPVRVQSQGAPPSPDVLRARAHSALARQRATPSAAVEAPDPGTVLASLPRPDGTQLRVSAHTFEGKPYVRVAPWATRDAGATWWPVKGKGASVRVRELAAVAAGLLDALAAVGNDGAAPTTAR